VTILIGGITDFARSSIRLSIALSFSGTLLKNKKVQKNKMLKVFRDWINQLMCYFSA